MKGKQHFNLSCITGACFFLLVFHIADLYGPEQFLLTLDISMFELFLFMVFGLLLISFSALLPDSDSDNKGSVIFYTPLSPIAHMLNALEKVLAFILRKRIGHRQLMHRPLGILIGTILIVGIVIALSYLLGYNNALVFIYIFASVFIGQTLHVIQDKLNTMIPNYAYHLYVAFILALTVLGYYALNHFFSNVI